MIVDYLGAIGTVVDKELRNEGFWLLYRHGLQKRKRYFVLWVEPLGFFFVWKRVRVMWSEDSRAVQETIRRRALIDHGKRHVTSRWRQHYFHGRQQFEIWWFWSTTSRSDSSEGFKSHVAIRSCPCQSFKLRYALWHTYSTIIIFACIIWCRGSCRHICDNV
jgi:hypothetical protein